jgi:hypothetical protein
MIAFLFDVLTECTEVVKLQLNFQLPNFLYSVKTLMVHFVTECSQLDI